MPNGVPWPRISIVTPSLNQGLFIEETIRSVLLQGYPDLEYIVIDGGSTDDSVEIIKKYERWLTFWVSERDRGQSHAVNKGFSKASGEIYSWLNSDDYLMPNALRNIALAYESFGDSGAWCGGCLRVDSNDKVLRKTWPNRLAPEAIADWPRNNYAQSACFFSKDAWHKCGPLDEELCYVMDLDLWIKIARTSSIGKVNNLLSADHVHEKAKTQTGRALMYAEIFLVQMRHGYRRLAVQDSSKAKADYVALMLKLEQILRFSLFKPFRPIALAAWRRFPRHRLL
jgi:glycosyltransferase involved in cell wall biosynthesis